MNLFSGTDTGASPYKLAVSKRDLWRGSEQNLMMFAFVVWLLALPMSIVWALAEDFRLFEQNIVLQNPTPLLFLGHALFIGSVVCGYQHYRWKEWIKELPVSD